MRFKLLFTLGLMGIIIISSSTIFASGVGLTGIGARATALAGCYRAVADDWSAMFWNPAGITQIEGLKFGMSLELIKPTATFTPKEWNYALAQTNMFGIPTGEYDYLTTDFSNMKTSATDNEPRTFYIPAFGITYGMENLTLGFAFYVPFGLGAKWDLLNTEKYNSTFPKIDYEDDLKIMDFHPTIAYKVSDRLSLGVGVSLVYADIIIRTPKYVPNPYLITPDIAGFTRRNLLPVGADAPEFNHLLIDSELKGTGMGYGGNLGVMFNVTENLKVGLSARYYSDISIDGKINATAYFADLDTANTLIKKFLPGIVKSKLESGELDSASYGVLLNYYSGGSSVVYADMGGDTKLPLPMEFGVGIAYSGIKNLLVSADFSMTKWSAWDIIKIDLEDGDVSNLIENWKDGMRFGVGAEYKLGIATLRGGYYYEEAAVPDETMSPTIPDINTRSAVNLGLQYNFGPIAWHLSYETILIGDKTIDNYIFNATENSYDNLAGDYAMKVYNIMTGFEYKF
ncbi:outer membrane protein transport protein [candidate division KSB1 bacterium]|nr:outer membrane protein transport protein [candidate division KSB1 bacterium]